MAINDPTTNPRYSIPTTTSNLTLFWDSQSTRGTKISASESRNKGEMSLNITPFFGKSGQTCINFSNLSGFIAIRSFPIHILYT
jgi:hypothetical protein